MKFILVHDTARQRAIEAVKSAPDGFSVVIKEPTRSLEQNSLLWSILTDVSEQVDWYGEKLDPVEWKDVFTAALKKQKVVKGIDGGFVVCGQSTSRMTKAEFSDLCKLIFSFGAQYNVKFSA